MTPSTAATVEGSFSARIRSSRLGKKRDCCDHSELLEQAIPKLADRLDFRAFATHAFAWLDGMQENAPDTADDFTEYADEKATWNDLISEISSQYGVDQVTLHLLLQELDLRSKAPKPPTGAVPCFTIHASKGMSSAMSISLDSLRTSYQVGQLSKRRLQPRDAGRAPQLLRCNHQDRRHIDPHIF